MTAMNPSLRPRTFAGALGVLAVLAALLLLLLPVRTTVNAVPVSCGNGFTISRHAEQGSALFGSEAAIARGDRIAPIDKVEDVCASAQSHRATLAWTLLGLGVVTLAGAVLVRNGRPTTAPSPAH